MGALRNNFTPASILEHSIRAGADLILGTGGLDTFELIRQVEALVESGVLSEELIDEGVRRILRLKLRYGLLPAEEEEAKP
jgi:beta-glucosidase-like glycosyl hydrolase